MQTSYWGCPGQGAYLTNQVLTSRSQLQQCKLCKKLPSKASQASLRHTVTICMSWTQCQTPSRSPVWPWKTGIRPNQADPTLSLVISRLQDGTLGQQQSKQTDPSEFNQFLWEWNHLLLWKGVLYRRPRASESEETLLQLVLPAAHREGHSKWILW